MDAKKETSLEDVARYCGLSVVTVSRVLNGAPSVRDYNREKVERAVRELNYIPNAAARTLAKGKTGIIAMITPDLKDPFFREIVQSVNQVLIRHNLFLAISITSHQGCDYVLQQQRVDGVLLLTPGLEKELVKKLRQRHMPFVSLDSQNRSADYSCVQVDNFDGGFQAGNYFLDMGHRKIGFIGGPMHLINSREREHGLAAALARRGLSLYCSGGGDFSFREGYHVMKNWMEQGTMPTAVFAADCNLAMGAMTAIREAGFKIPADVSVCGFDDEPMAQEYVPALTTLAQPVREMAECAVEHLLLWAEGRRPGQMVCRFKPHLIVRDSAGPLGRGQAAAGERDAEAQK